jgi:hypothetical protein
LPTPPDNQIFPTSAFAADFTFQDPPPAVKNGFDARCYVIGHPGIDIDVDELLRPDVVNCCWQRAMCMMLYLLTEPRPNAIADFRAACALLWGDDAVITIIPPNDITDRWAWIETDTYQILFRVGTQEWAEIFEQSFHGLQPPSDYGTFSTSPVWFDESTEMSNALNAFGWDPNKRVTMIGHSKGGAVLYILARRMLINNPDRSIDVLTFGSPKVGDTRLVEQDGIRAARHVIHRQDVVPLIPPNSSLLPLLDEVFPLLNLAPVTRWQNFRIYQITGDGWGNGIEQAGELAWQTYSAWISLLLAARVPEPIEQHFLSSYVAALAECCDGPVFPFSTQYWQLLFGDVIHAPGGNMIGGGAKLDWTQGTDTGLAIGGAGTVYANFILQEDAYPIVDENGDPILLE